MQAVRIGARRCRSTLEDSCLLARMNQFFRQPAVVAGAAVLTLRGLTLVSRFLLSLLLARMLVASEVGDYGLITAFLAFAMLAVGLEFYSYTLRELVPASPSACVRIVGDQIVLAAGMLALTAAGTLVAAWFGFLSVNVALWCLLILVTEHLSLEGTRILIILSRPVRAYIGLFLRGGLWVFVVAALMYSDPSTRSLAVVLFWWALGGAASILFTAVSLSHLPWRELRSYRPNWTAIAGGLRIARPFLLTAVGALTLNYFDRLLIDIHLGRDAVGVYTFYSTIAIGLLSLSASISHQFLPKVIAGFEQGAAAFRNVLRTFGYSIAGVGSLAVAAAAVAIGPIVSILQLDAYVSGIQAFYLMLIGVILRMLSDVPSYALYAARRDKELLICNLSAAGVSVLLNLILIPQIGLFGAGIANAVASGILLLSLTVLAVRRLRPPA